MKSTALRTCAVALVMLGLAAASNPTSSMAQGTTVGSTEGAAMGKAYLSASDAGYVSNVNVTPFVPFHVYLLVEIDYAEIGRPELNGEVAMSAYEVGVNIPGLGADVAITDSVIRNGVISVSTDTDLIIGVYPPLMAYAAPTWLVDYTMLVLNPANVSDLVATLGPVSLTSFNDEVPGFAENMDVGECVRISDGAPAKCIRPFALLGSLSLNCVNECIDESPIPVETPTWSRVKANFGG